MLFYSPLAFTVLFSVLHTILSFFVSLSLSYARAHTHTHSCDVVVSNGLFYGQVIV